MLPNGYRGTQEELDAGVAWLMQKPPYPKSNNINTLITKIMEPLPFYKVPGSTPDEPTKYYLKEGPGLPDSEINQWQYEQLTALTERPISGSLSEAAILRLHQESDPASPLYKGPESTEGGGPEGNKDEVSTKSGFYDEPFRGAPAAITPESTGTSVHTTEDATKANAGITSEKYANISKEEIEAKIGDAIAAPAPEETTDESNA